MNHTNIYIIQIIPDMHEDIIIDVNKIECND